VQQLAVNKRILVLGEVTGTRNGDGWFSVDDLMHMFEILRVPDPASVTRSLGQLRKVDWFESAPLKKDGL